eukprot:3868744-Alexandrium_andersonii.AAC.1
MAAAHLRSGWAVRVPRPSIRAGRTTTPTSLSRAWFPVISFLAVGAGVGGLPTSWSGIFRMWPGPSRKRVPPGGKGALLACR